jgi:GH25 family lysozyme M1 (1,4-beta-N-acetylmuramidase)
MIPGIDVYEGYGAIDWNLVASSGVRFAWIRCQVGNDRRDEAYVRNVQRARDAGIVVGAYHFAYPLPDDWHKARLPLEQAKLFFEACGGLGSQPGELSPALDLEWPSPVDWMKWGCTAQQISDWGRECAEAMALLWGRLPVIYTYPWWWQTVSKSADVSWAARYPLWMASYTHSWAGVPENGAPPVPPPWTNWAAWQYSAEGSQIRVPGIPACPIDRDCIKDEATFERLQGSIGDDEPTLRELPDPEAA